jgi:hypothetical protein
MRARRALAGTGVAIALLIAGFCLYWPALGAFNRLLRMPPEVGAPYVESLARTPSAADAQRKRLVDAWRSRRDYGLRRTQLTIEATPVELWLITSGGGLTYVVDYTRDAYSNRGVYTAHPVSVEVGAEKPDEAHPLRAWFPTSEQAYLRCKLSNGSVEFF